MVSYVKPNLLFIPSGFFLLVIFIWFNISCSPGEFIRQPLSTNQESNDTPLITGRMVSNFSYFSQFWLPLAISVSNSDNYIGEVAPNGEFRIFCPSNDTYTIFSFYDLNFSRTLDSGEWTSTNFINGIYTTNIGTNTITNIIIAVGLLGQLPVNGLTHHKVTLELSNVNYDAWYCIATNTDNKYYAALGEKYADTRSNWFYLPEGSYDFFVFLDTNQPNFLYDTGEANQTVTNNLTVNSQMVLPPYTIATQ